MRLLTNQKPLHIYILFPLLLLSQLQFVPLFVLHHAFLIHLLPLCNPRFCNLYTYIELCHLHFLMHLHHHHHHFFYYLLQLNHFCQLLQDFPKGDFFLKLLSSNCAYYLPIIPLLHHYHCLNAHHQCLLLDYLLFFVFFHCNNSSIAIIFNLMLLYFVSTLLDQLFLLQLLHLLFGPLHFIFTCCEFDFTYEKITTQSIM